MEGGGGSPLHVNTDKYFGLGLGKCDAGSPTPQSSTVLVAKTRPRRDDRQTGHEKNLGGQEGSVKVL